VGTVASRELPLKRAGRRAPWIGLGYARSASFSSHTAVPQTLGCVWSILSFGKRGRRSVWPTARVSWSPGQGRKHGVGCGFPSAARNTSFFFLPFPPRVLYELFIILPNQPTTRTTEILFCERGKKKIALAASKATL
jgi:hypothetical protein